PSTSFPASQVEQAFRLLARGKHIGKVCIALADPALRVEPGAPPPRLRADATYLVTGGLGGFGLAVARWLAGGGARHLLLLSRGGADADEAKPARAALRARGVTVHAVAADVGRRADVERALAACGATLPPLRGIIHSATVLDDRPLAALDGEALARVM